MKQHELSRQFTDTAVPMAYRAEHGFSCLPVTALHTINHKHATLLFSNEGATLCLRFDDSTSFVYRHRIFARQNIHGIVSCLREEYEAYSKHYLIIWGGKLVTIMSMTLSQEPLSHGKCCIVIEKFSSKTMGDWIMTISIEHTKSSVFLLTTHNALWNLELDNYEIAQWRILSRATATLLYSATIALVATDHAMVASGTVFGEVIVWDCRRSPSSQEWSTVARQTYLGHRGSIFGVAFSDSISFNNQQHRLLASCSDDRTIRIWNVGDHENEPESLKAVENDYDGTGFGTADRSSSELTTVWAHASRIWGVRFLNSDTSSADITTLISHGEDGVCQTWTIKFDALFSVGSSSDCALIATEHDRHHAGKNLWSLFATSQGAQATVYTGGADGRIVSRFGESFSNRLEDSSSFRDIARTVQPYIVRGLKQYLLLQDGNLFATSDDGMLLRSHKQHLQRWQTMYIPPKRGTTMLCSNSALGLVLYCSANGMVSGYDTVRDIALPNVIGLGSRATWMQIVHSESRPNGVQVVHLVANLYEATTSKLIIITRVLDDVHTTTWKIPLPSDFVVSSSILDTKRGTLICGSRAGALAIFTNVGSSLSEEWGRTITRHAHGSDTVTSIMVLSRYPNSSLDSSIYILTTGRDGTFAVHHIKIDETDAICMTLHRATPPFGPYIEGAYIASDRFGKDSLTLYGFKSKDFVVWNETNQIQMLSVECGGAHRSWSCSLALDNSISFVWTKAGSVHAIHKVQRNLKLITYGGHGREIKSLAVSISSPMRVDHFASAQVLGLFATGAEDTEIRLTAYTTNGFSHLTVLKQHTTGIQALKFSSCGHYLFSSGGVEEFVAWRLNNIPLLGIGTTVVGLLQKHEGDEDARIMSFDLLQEDQDSTIATFLVLMAYSNGKAKLFEFKHNLAEATGSFELVQQVIFGTLCLTQTRLLKVGTAPAMLLGGTDGHLRFSFTDTIDEAIINHKVHQSNIASLSVHQITPQSYLLATGGDDNALALTLLQTKRKKVELSTISIPSAHAAAVTSIAFISLPSLISLPYLYLVSAGNDQVVKLWRISGSSDRASLSISTQNPTAHDELSNLQLEKVTEFPTDVADVSDLEVVRSRQDEKDTLVYEICVVGVGIQIIHFVVGA